MRKEVSFSRSGEGQRRSQTGQEVENNGDQHSRHGTADHGAITPDLGDGYAAAVTNFKFIANAVVTTEEAVEAMEQSGSDG